MQNKFSKIKVFTSNQMRLNFFFMSDVLLGLVWEADLCQIRMKSCMAFVLCDSYDNQRIRLHDGSRWKQHQKH